MSRGMAKAPAKKKVAAAEVRTRLQAVEMMLREGWPVGRIADAMRTTYGAPTASTARYVERVRARWAEAHDRVPAQVHQQRELAQIDDMINRLRIDQGPDGKQLETKDPKRVDEILRLFQLRAKLSGSARAANFGRHPRGPDGPGDGIPSADAPPAAYLGIEFDHAAATAPELLGDDEDAE